ncbi:MAG: serine/threonine protein kinase, partial [Geothrix sp.]
PPTRAPETNPTGGGAPRLGWLLALLSVLGGAAFLRWRRGRTRPEASFKEPEQLGPYRIERLLGRGGFASTYLAYHTATRRPVALKLLHPYRHDDPEFLRRFRQEAKLGAMLDHPNLVRMLDPGPESGTPWLAMEYISGRRLDQKLREDGPPSLSESIRIALEIAGAMAHAHGLGIVHRDLKPGNVIFDGDQVKVMDFGISRIVDSTTLTTTYAFLGTPKYAAPEAQLKAQVGPAADRYAFGIMLFELLAGHAPFDGETPFEILEQHQKTPLPDLAVLRPDLPPDLVDLIQRLCRKQPGERPDDQETIRTLEQIQTELPPRG